MSKELDDIDMVELEVARNEYLEKKFGERGLEGERRQAVYFLYKVNSGEMHPAFEKMAKSSLRKSVRKNNE